MAQPSMKTAINLAIKGLYLNPSTFGDNAPNGALTIADNVVIDRPSVVATRRGLDNSFATVATAAVAAGALGIYQFGLNLILHDDTNTLYHNANGTSGFTPFTGTYAVPDNNLAAGSRIRSVELNKNFYFITDVGAYRLDSILGQPRLAGAPAGLSGFGSSVGVTGFLPTNTQVAYRVVFGYKDVNQQLVLGAPSSRFIVTNTSGTSANTSVTFQQPREVVADPTNFFFQVYRGHASPNLTTEPDDEMALTYEESCTGVFSVTISDITPDSLLGAALYTNQGQDGILQSNYRPPWSTDITSFKQYTFYSDTRTVHNANATLISAGASNGPDAIVPGDTIVFAATEFGGPTFTMLAVSGANNDALGWFNVSNTGNPGLDIQVTATNIALVANAYPGNTFLDAYYTSLPSELPGQLRFNRLDFNVSPFTITPSNHAAWEQAIPITSTNDARPNRIYFSKFNQPEAVPVVNYFVVGSANQPINRIIPLRDGVMVLKQDGVFRISGSAPTWQITPIDYNIRILAPNTAVQLDNKVYFLSDQGIVAMSDSDGQVMSFVLDKTIIENTSPDLFPNLKATAWGLAYQADRKYILAMPGTSGDLQATQQYVYNHFTQVWTRWTLEASCGLIFIRDGKMYLGSYDSAPYAGSYYVYKERKSLTNNDFADNQYTTSNTTAGALNTIIVANPLLPVGVSLLPGWSILQAITGASARIVSTTVGVSFTTIVLDKVQNWAASNVIIYSPVYSEVQTIQIDCENPGMNKQFSEMIFMFTQQGFTQITARISSNTAGVPAIDYLVPTQRGGWGIDPWGPTPWGGGPVGQGKIRRYVPQAIQRAGWLYINLTNAEAFTTFGLSGIQIPFKDTSTRQL